MPVFMLTGAAELMLMALSAIGILLVLIIWPISILYNRHAKPAENDAPGDEEKSKDRSSEESHDR